MDRKIIVAVVTEAQAERIKSAAEAESRSVSNLIKHAVMRYIDGREHEARA